MLSSLSLVKWKAVDISSVYDISDYVPDFMIIKQVKWLV